MLKNILYLIIIIILIAIFYKSFHNKESFYNYEKTNFPIDVVYTWAGENKTNNIRSSYNNELEYSVLSVIKFLPWVNHIYVLMNPPATRASWMTKRLDKMITFVDESQTFPKKYSLPNTNSNAIETTIHNIPNLSEHYIYFNDDFFVGKPLPYTYFFTEDGKAQVSNLCEKTSKMVKSGKKTELNIKLPDMGPGFYPHVPISLLKSEVKKYHSEFPEYIDWVRNIKSRKGLGCQVCTDNNLSCPCQQQHFIIAKYMYDNGKAVLKNYNIGSGCTKNGYINSECLDYLNDIIKNPPPTFCIQDTTNNPKKKLVFKEKLNNFFEKFYN